MRGGLELGARGFEGWKDIQAELEKHWRLREIGFYESGSATLRASSRDALDRLEAIPEKRTESMRIEGHTDNIPIHNARFASNWELSTSRASELIRVFVERYRMDPARLSAAGYAEFHPVAANDTAEGRARNRRVDIVAVESATLSGCKWGR